MFEDVVRFEAFRHLGEVRPGGWRFACSTDSRFRIANDVERVIDEPGLLQRDERQKSRGGVATRVGQQRRLANAGSMDLSEPVNCRFEARNKVVLEAIPLWV